MNARDLAPEVHEHFADPTVRAGYMLAMIRAEFMPSRDVPGYAAAIVADLADAGPAMTAIAMAPPGVWLSELAPLLDEVETEVGHVSDERGDAEAIVLMQAYLAVMDGDLWRRHRYIVDLVDRKAAPDALRDFADTSFLGCGDGGDEALVRVRCALANYLNERFSPAG